MIKDNKEFKGFCFRCEHRAKYFESGGTPRCECGDSKFASHGCYMYRPVKPLGQIPVEGEKRPIIGGWMWAGRSKGVVVDMQLTITKIGKVTIQYWKPVNNKTKTKKRKNDRIL